jgi:hypothetical protein
MNLVANSSDLRLSCVNRYKHVERQRTVAISSQNTTYKLGVWVHRRVGSLLISANANPMQSSSCEANSRSNSQEILWHVKYPKLHYRVHNSPPLDPIVSQMNSVRTLIQYFFNIHFNIILPYTLSLPSGILISGFLAKILCKFLTSHTRYISSQSHFPLFDQANET